MRIADVSPRVVYPPERGSGLRTYNLLSRLSRAHEVRQFSQGRSGALWSPRSYERAPVAPGYEELRFAHPAATLVGELAERAWVCAPILSGAALRVVRPRPLAEILAWADVVLVEFPWQFEFCRRRADRTPLVLASHNVEHDKFRSYAEYVRPRLRAPWLRAIRRMEAGAARGADLVVAVSDADRLRFVETYGLDPDRVVVVRNGVDTRRFRPAPPGARRAARRRLGLPERPTVLFAGSAVPPNRAGLEVVERVARVAPELTFVVVGPVSPQRTDGNLVATGRVADMRPWLEAADVSICPIRHGGGTKMKLLEALAAGLPTVAFDHAVHGTELQAGEHLLVVPPDDEAVVEALSRLTTDETLASAVAAAGRAFVVDHHDWARLAGDLERALLRVVDGARSPSRAEPAARSATSRRPDDRAVPTR